MPSDTDLLARLNALRPSTISLSTKPTLSDPPAAKQAPISIARANELSTSKPALPPSLPPASFVAENNEAEEADPILSLTARFLALNKPTNAATAKPHPPPERVAQPIGADHAFGDGDIEIETARAGVGGARDGERSLSDLIRELGMDAEEFRVGRGEERDLGKLVREVRGLVGEEEGAKVEGVGELGGANGMGEGEGKEVDEEAEADEYIARVLAELEVGRKFGVEDGEERRSDADSTGDECEDGIRAEEDAKEKADHDSSTLKDSQNPAKANTQDTAAHPKSTNTKDNPVQQAEDDPFNLPSAPSTTLEDPPPPYDATEALTARLNALSLPSAPSFAPSKKPPITETKPPKEYTDEDIDSWCVMCNDDGALKCKGCDDEVYCRGCWAEGHTGPDAGYDERRHKAVVFSKSKR